MSDKTIRDALGPQGKMPVFTPEEGSMSQADVNRLYEYRMDVLSKIDPRLGLQFVEDSPLPWLNPQRIKLNLGKYRNFTADNWINVTDERDPDPRAEFRMRLEDLKLEQGSVDFIYAPFVLAKISDPVAALRNWLYCIRSTGFVCVVIEDEYKKIRMGLPFKFEGPICTEEKLKSAMRDAGFADLVAVNFNAFDLAGVEPYYVGYFGSKT